jgi:hypothetical protein
MPISGFTHSARCARGAFLMSLFLLLALSACGGNGSGYLVSTNQSPTAVPTKTGTATPTPKPGNAFAYAFVRDGQVWLAQAGKSPRQLSQLITSSGQSISALAWSPDGKHLTFELSGSGNPVDYVIDASTGNFSALNLPSTKAAAILGWANNTTIIGVKLVSGNTQFWKTDITTNAASQLTQVTGSPQVQIVGGGIFYSEFDANTNQIMLHRYDVSAGSEGTPVAITPAGTSTLKVNWDVSPDGSHVLTGFRLPTPDSSWDNGFWSVNFNDSTDRSPVFTNDELPFNNIKDTDTVTLSYSSDGQTVLIDTNGAVGPVSEGLDDSNFTTYSPHVNVTSPGQISWAPNSASFVINSTGDANQATIYTVASKSAGSTFVDKATLLQWAPKS